MAKRLIDDALWSRIERLLPKPPRRRFKNMGRPRVSDRAALTGILFVLRTGIPWQMLPKEMGCGSGSTCWRRLVRWQRAGVWRRLHALLLAELRQRTIFSGSIHRTQRSKRLMYAPSIVHRAQLAINPHYTH